MYRLSYSSSDSGQRGVSQGGGMIIIPLQECHQPDEDHCLEVP